MRSLLVALVLCSSLAFAERLTVQRGATGGTTRDCYVWEEAPAYNGNSDTLYTGLVGSTDKVSFLFFDVSALPPDARVSEARLILETYATSGVEIELHPVTADWAETFPTWTNFIGNVSPNIKVRFTPVAGRNVIDVTFLVQTWIAPRQNFGVALRQAPLTSSTTFRSSDSMPDSLRPALEVIYEPIAPLVETSVPALSASCSVPFRYPLRAHAPNATRFTTTSTDVALDEVTGELTWTPTRGDRGSHAFTVEVSDGSRSEPIAVELDVQCSGPLTVGCSASGFGPGLLVLGLLLVRRRPS
ncbi:MAG: DNRLRE domain-containing protein [Archangium sp.]|nr:DNRLRE domain-containing protein [Archangium sp.]